MVWMHVALAIFMIFAVWRWGDWRNWSKYHTVMLFFALGNLLYNFLTAGHFLWRLESVLLPNHTVTEMLYTFIIFPASALLFICNYPQGKLKIFLHYVYWVALYVGVEAIMMVTDFIKYQYGWSLWWSAGFDMIMFPMLYLYYKRPLIAYIISIPIALFLIWYFDIPVHIPVEKR